MTAGRKPRNYTPERLTLRIRPDVAALLERLASSEQTSKTEIIERGIQALAGTSCPATRRTTAAAKLKAIKAILEQ